MNKKGIIALFIVLVILLVAGIVFYFKNNTYTIQFYDEGKLVETLEVRKNRPIKEPTSPTKDGYMFIGWYENGELFNFDNNITKDINLIAGWGKITTEE